MQKAIQQKTKSKKTRKHESETQIEQHALPDFHPDMLTQPLTQQSVIALQRFYGNRFVTQLCRQRQDAHPTLPAFIQRTSLLRNESIQRCPGCGGSSTEEGECEACKEKRLARNMQEETDTVQLKGEDIGHNLTASDFTGQITLEDCFDGKSTLRAGSSDSDAVTRVQNALIKLGIPLSQGANGIFNAETTKAVKQFQTKSGLSGGDVDGIIGKKTMGLLDAASRDGAVHSDDDKKSNDLKVIGKYQDSAKEPLTLFFDASSSELDTEESDKIKKIAQDHPNKQLILKGTSSEEGGAGANTQIAGKRVDTVSKQLIDAKQIDAKDKATLHIRQVSPESGKGDLEYRKIRAVKVLLQPEKKEDTETCAPGTKGIIPCKPEFEDALKKAVPEAVKLIQAAKKKLPPKGDTVKVFDSLFGTDDTTRAATVAKVSDIMDGMIDHIGKMTDVDRHRCANKCDGICKTGSPAYNSDNGEGNPPGVLTMCPPFVGFEDGEAIVLVHEGHHGTPKIDSQDFAYPTTRLITQLDTDTALKNAASFHLFVSWVKDPSTQIGPKEKDKQGNLTDAEKKKIDLPIAWLEQWLTMAEFDLSTLYSTIRDSQGCKDPKCKWGSSGHATAIMEEVAPRFKLTPAHLQPKKSDQEAVAALYDRVSQMSRTFNGALTFNKVAAGGQTVWKEGPGKELTLAQDFFNMQPSQMIVALMQELVHATDNVSPAAEPEYVAIIDNLRRIRKLGGPTP